MQGIVIKCVINFFSISFIWLKHSDTKNWKMFVKDFYWLISQVNLVLLWNEVFFNSELTKKKQKNKAKQKKGKSNFMHLIFFVTTVLLQSLTFFLSAESFIRWASELNVDFGKIGFSQEINEINLSSKASEWLFISFFTLKLSDLNFHGFFILICGIVITSIKSEICGLIYFFTEKLLLYGTITSNVN